MSTTPTYWDYLNLDKLLTLQSGLDDNEDDQLADELHFIIVHQTYELWFKLVLRSLRLARNELMKQNVDEKLIPVVAHHLRRVNAILKLGVNQFEVMETLTPQDFLDFRDKLVPSSGFQSFQMREIEILMGLLESERLHYGGVDPIEHIEKLAADTPAGRMANTRIQAVREEKCLLTCLNDWLYRTPVQGSVPTDPDDDAVVTAFLEEYLEAISDNLDGTLDRLATALQDTDGSTAKRFAGIKEQARAFLMADIDTLSPEEQRRMRRIRAAALFIESYRHLPLLSWPRLLLDVVVEMEEQLVMWRHRHARMVERLIGRRVGTGGSGGVEYLDKTGAYRVFKDLWAIRTVMLPRVRLPKVKDPAFYGFK
jgi:tryptophan 2,3-dioxygenase